MKQNISGSQPINRRSSMVQCAKPRLLAQYICAMSLALLLDGCIGFPNERMSHLKKDNPFDAAILSRNGTQMNALAFGGVRQAIGSAASIDSMEIELLRSGARCTKSAAQKKQRIECHYSQYVPVILSVSPSLGGPEVGRNIFDFTVIAHASSTQLQDLRVCLTVTSKTSREQLAKEPASLRSGCVSERF